MHWRIGTPFYASSNFDKSKAVTSHDDFESLGFSVHALRIGVSEWERIASAGKPSFLDLCQADPLMRSLAGMGLLSGDRFETAQTWNGIRFFAQSLAVVAIAGAVTVCELACLCVYACPELNI